MNKNASTYNQHKYVAYWEQQVELQVPEKVIFSIYKDALKDFTFLDVGVGCGRTTLYFAPYVKNYIGVDIAPEMIKSCKKRFDHLSDSLTFQTLDASDLSAFEDNYFDFILFSYNGIDHLKIEERDSFFKEVRRVTKNNGILAYSSHNLNMIHKYYRDNVLLNFNPHILRMLKIFLKNIIRSYKIRTLNGDYRSLQKKDWTIFIDGAHNFNLTMYYSKPDWENKSLEKLGFKNIQIYDLLGKSLSKIELISNQDPWLYYLCTIEK
jgi:ubiquinone/menaquinone biosynthesis C-methylase UbiE